MKRSVEKENSEVYGSQSETKYLVFTAAEQADQTVSQQNA